MKNVFVSIVFVAGFALAGFASNAVAGPLKVGVCPSGTKAFSKSPGTNSNWSAAKPCCNTTSNEGLYSICQAKVPLVTRNNNR